MISLQALIGLSIVLTIIVSLIRFAIWIAWPRKTEFDPYAQPHGDVPHDGRRSNG